MWGELLGWFKFIVSLAKDAQRDRDERAKMRQEVDELTQAVQFLLRRDEQRRHDDEMRRRDEEQWRREQAQEREKLLLRLKIQLLEFERRLPPPLPGAPLAPPLRLEPD